MNRLKWLLVMPVIVMLAGCPYKSDIALDKTGKKLNAALLGKWEPKSNSNESFRVYKENDFTYRIVKYTKSSKDSTIYNGYMVDLDGDSFFNLWDASPTGDKGYYIYKVILSTSAAKVTLSPVTDNITEKFTTANEMKAFFIKYKSLSFFYDKIDEVYIKE